MRSVRQIIYAQMVDMGGIPVRQPLPTSRVDQVDPFLLLHHHTAKIKAGSNSKTLGVGPHPHRGFSPVTFIFQGDVHHRDSRGNDSVVKAGGIQWTDVGMGIIHSERPSAALAEKGGTQEIIQLWINTPKSHKMDQPVYIPVQKEDLIKIPIDSGKGQIGLVTGEQNNIKGSLNPKLPLITIMGELEPETQHTFTIPTTMNCMLYLLDGQLSVKAHGIVDGLNLIVFENDEELIQITAKAKTRFLLLAGKPLAEPVATYGPFVMNTQTEIMEAMRDYQIGKMGVLVEEF